MFFLGKNRAVFPGNIHCGGLAEDPCDGPHPAQGELPQVHGPTSTNTCTHTFTSVAKLNNFVSRHDFSRHAKRQFFLHKHGLGQKYFTRKSA